MLKVIGSITVAVVLLLGAFRLLDGGIEIGVLLAAVLYTRNFFSPIENLAMFITRPIRLGCVGKNLRCLRRSPQRSLNQQSPNPSPRTPAGCLLRG